MSSPVFIDNKSCKNLVMVLWKRDFFGLVNYFAEHRGIFRFIKSRKYAKLFDRLLTTAFEDAIMIIQKRVNTQNYTIEV